MGEETSTGPHVSRAASSSLVSPAPPHPVGTAVALFTLSPPPATLCLFQALHHGLTLCPLLSHWFSSYLCSSCVPSPSVPQWFSHRQFPAVLLSWGCPTKVPQTACFKKKQKLIVLPFQRPEVWNQTSARPCSLWSLKGTILLPLPTSGIPGNPGCSLATPSSPPFVIAWPSHCESLTSHGRLPITTLTTLD